MRILFLSPRQCYPSRSGAKLREYHFLRALAEENDVSYLHFTDPGAAALTRADLPFCRTVTAVPKPPAYGVWNLARGAVGGIPLPILNYRSAPMFEAVKRQAGQYDCVHLDSIHMMSYQPALDAAAPCFYNWHNIESEAMQRYSATVGSPWRAWYGRQTARKLQAMEKRILSAAQGHIVCSGREREQLRQMHPQARVEVVGNGVDVAYFSPEEPLPHRDRSPRFVFVGAMDYFPNADAALWFVRQVWPQVRSRLPEAQLSIVGANPGPDVRALGSEAGVAVTGTVPDVRPYYRDALAAVVPLRTGGGTRLKILEAMAAGIPVVSTPLGAEGLDVSPGRDILQASAEDPASWLRPLEELKTSEPLWNNLAETARRRVSECYGWDILGRRLAGIYRGWMEHRHP